MKTRLLMFVIVITMLSCQSDSDPEPEMIPTDSTLLTLDTKDYALLTGTTSWVFVVDQSGEILDSKSFEAGKMIKLSGQTDDEFLTLVRVNRYSSSDADILVYGGVEKGTTHKFAYTDGTITPMPAYQGDATIRVTKFADIPNNPLVIASGDVNEREYASDGEVNASFPIYGNNVNLILSGFNSDGVLVYKLVSGVSAGESVVEDFTTFTPYASTIEVPDDKNVTYLLAGYTKDWEYYGAAFSSHQWYTGSATPPVMGYLPGYDGYYTLAWSIFPGDNYVAVSYRKRGSLPTTSDMELPSFNYSIVNSSVQNPQFSIDRDYHYMHAQWSYTPGSQRIICNSYAPKGFRIKLKNLPEEILTLHPELNLQNLTFNQCDFTEYLDGYTYQQTLNDFLTHHFHLETFEYRLYEFAE